MSNNEELKAPIKNNTTKIKYRRKSSAGTSLSEAQYEEIFNAVINSTAIKNASDKSPAIANSPGKSKAKSPKESASTENSQNSTKNKHKNTKVKNNDTSSISTFRSEDFSKNAVYSTPNKILKPKTYREALKNLEKMSDSVSQAGSVNTSIMEIEGFPLSQPAKTLTRRQRLEWLQERRGTGLWVQCDKMDCNKWRWLNVADPTELPDKWYCNMNPDKKLNSCKTPEVPIPLYEEDDLIHNSYTAGSIVWAKMNSYPWWPGMVDDDPDTEQYYWIDDEFSVIPNWYHVIFFDGNNQVSRAWIPVKGLRPFNDEDLTKSISRSNIYFNRLSTAKKCAQQAKQLDVKGRLKKYSFLARWKEDIPDYTSDYETDNEINKENNNKKLKRRNSTKNTSIKKNKKCNAPSANKNVKRNNVLTESKKKKIELGKKTEELNINDKEEEIHQKVEKIFKLYKKQQKVHNNNVQDNLTNKIQQSLNESLDILETSLQSVSSSKSSTTYQNKNKSPQNLLFTPKFTPKKSKKKVEVIGSQKSSTSIKKHKIEDENLSQLIKRQKKGFVTPMKPGNVSLNSSSKSLDI